MVVVAEQFEGLPLIKVSARHLLCVITDLIIYPHIVLQRHRLVMDTLKEELAGGVHALSIQVCCYLQGGSR